MKKLLYLFSASLLVLASCSKDDNTPDPATSTLVKKVIYTDINKSIYTSETTYNGNKIVSTLGSDGSKIVYTYTGEIITKVEETDGKGALESTTEYTYTNGKLATSLEKEVGADYNYKTVYTYNADGTVSFADVMINTKTGTTDDGGTVGKYTYSAGNLVKKVYSYYGKEYSSTFEYDTKNNPSKNVTGFSLLLDNEDEASVNNVVKRTSSSSISTNTYKYDANGFPTEQQSFHNGISDGTSQFTY
jgi:hypothetical protein